MMKSHPLPVEQRAPRVCGMALPTGLSQGVLNCTGFAKDGIFRAGGLDLAPLTPLKNPTSP